MPPKKKNIGTQAGSGENQKSEISVNHVSMHNKGLDSSEEVI